jgi:hypothetical protein
MLNVSRLVKKGFLTAMLAVSCVFADGNPFFPTREGISFTMASLNAKGKVEDYTRTTIKKVEEKGDTLAVTSVFEFLDKKRQPKKGEAVEATINIVNGVVVFDMPNFFEDQENSDFPVKLEIEGNYLELPTNISVGEEFARLRVALIISTPLRDLTRTVEVKHKCVAFEPVTVPAGTFDAYKIEETITHKTIMGRTREEINFMWYARNLGTIKTEKRDRKGKFISGTELVEFKN